MTYIRAALTILAHADRPLTVPEITAVAVAEDLIRPRGKTPDRTMASVLYRRMAADPDAPVMSRGGRFWLRTRPLPAAETAYLRQGARRRRSPMPGVRARRSMNGRAVGSPRASALLPSPPLRLPHDRLPGQEDAAQGGEGYQPLRRERAIVRAGERAAPLLARLAARRGEDVVWDVARTNARLVKPLLAHLGYRSCTVAAHDEHVVHRVLAYLLHAHGTPAIALQVRRLTHNLDDDDAWRVLGLAQQVGAPYGAVTNGREIRLYSAAVAEAQDSAAAALALALDLVPLPDGSEAQAMQSAALWLLARGSVAGGALDAYVTDRAVGAALLDALDAPDSRLAMALVAEVHARTGQELPVGLVLRHARLALRSARGRDGEPLAGDIATVAAARGPLLPRAIAGCVATGDVAAVAAQEPSAGGSLPAILQSA